ncbi:MAG: sigma-70 family RNA polymerase sigma factor [Solirubrobacterales bacterium]|nr:sigma-70 family RNA polymerase sigma factor [Solirubrobacterales bacterium]
MARPRTPSERNPDGERNARLTEWLMTEKRQYLRAVAVRAGAPEWQLEDVVQGALLSFYRSFPGPDVPEKALAYCAACMASETSKARRRYARKESREQAMPERPVSGESEPIRDEGAADPAEAVLEGERIAELRRRLERLPADQRAVLLLAAAGYGPAEIAMLRGLTVRQVRKRIEKANRALRDDA